MLGLVVKDMPTALRFYRLLGLDIPAAEDEKGFVLHRMSSGVTLFDTMLWARRSRLTQNGIQQTRGMTRSPLSYARTPTLDIAYESTNSDATKTVVLLHGFPYDIRTFDEVVPLLTSRGFRVIVPYLRGFGPTRFLSESTLRSGQQAALAQDLIDLLDVLNIEKTVVAGYDWGGRAACIAAALFPDRVNALVSVDGYNIQDIAHSAEPASPETEATYWYQYYFQTERGRRGLERNRDELCELLWRTWSPTWAAASTEFLRSRESLSNPDFVDVVIHSYRHRYGAAMGDTRYQYLEDQLSDQPSIVVPTIVLDGLADGVGGGSAYDDAVKFTGAYEYRGLEGVGHNTPQEAPARFAQAVLDVSGLHIKAHTGKVRSS